MMKKNKRITLLACIPAILMLFISISCVIFVPQFRYSHYLRQKNYAELAVLYADKLKGLWGFDQQISVDLNNRIQAVYKDYQTDAIEYQAAQDEIESIVQTGYADRNIAQNTILSIQALNNSRKAYMEAVSKDETKEYVEAFNLYKHVIADDYNYEMAQNRIADIPKEFREYTEEAAAKEEETENFVAANRFLQMYLNFEKDDAFSQRLARNTAMIKAISLAEKGDFMQAQEILEAYKEDTIVSDKLEFYREKTDAEISASNNENRDSLA